MFIIKGAQLFVLLAFIYFSPKASIGQNKLLIMAIGSNENSNDLFLLPFIRNTLDSMTYSPNDPSISDSSYTQSQRKRLFDSVRSVNEYLDVKNYETVLGSTYFHFTLESLPGGDQQKRDAFAHELKSNNKFLLIKIARINSLIEYQFQLYSNINDTLVAKTNVYFVENPQKRLSTFINPEMPSHLSDLEHAIRKMFPESNEPPIGLIFLNHKPALDSLYSFSLRDTLSLDATNSIDTDTKSQYIQYQWEQLNSNKQLSMDFSKSSQSIVLRDTGFFHLRLTVYDGIEKSLPVDVCFNVQNRPIMNISPDPEIIKNKEKLLSKYIKEKGKMHIFKSKNHRFNFIKQHALFPLRELSQPTTYIKDSFKFRLINMDDEKLSWNKIKIEIEILPTHQVNSFPINDIKEVDDTIALSPNKFGFWTEVSGNEVEVNFKANLEAGEYNILVQTNNAGLKSKPEKVTIDHYIKFLIAVGTTYRHYKLSYNVGNNLFKNVSGFDIYTVLNFKLYLFRNLIFEYFPYSYFKFNKDFTFPVDDKVRLGRASLINMYFNFIPQYRMLEAGLAGSTYLLYVGKPGQPDIPESIHRILGLGGYIKGDVLPYTSKFPLSIDANVGLYIEFDPKKGDQRFGGLGMGFSIFHQPRWRSLQKLFLKTN